MANQNFKVKKGLEVGAGVTISGADGNINISGIITAQFKGDGSQLTGVTASGTGIVVQEEGSSIGTASTINFIGSNVTAALSGGIANVTVSGGSGGLSNVVEDTTPQLGGNLDLNGKNITGIGSISITGGFNATGVSTFQENVVFQSTASFGDNDKINVGAGNDLQIFHDGTSNIIKDAVGAGISLVGNTKVVGVLTATSFSGSLATTDLTGTITNAQLAGSISNDKLAGSIADSKLASTFLKNVVEDTTPQLGGNLDVNSKDITGTGNVSLTGVVTATSFSGSGIGLTSIPAGQLTGTVADARLSTVSSSKLSGALPALDGSALTDLTGASAGTYGASTNTPVITVDSDGRITGITTVATAGSGGGGGISNIVEDTTPQLGGNLDLNSKFITGTGNIDITGYAAVSGVSTFSGVAGFSSHITLPDYAEIQIGGATGGDLKIYHDAAHSYVSDEGTGNLKFRSNAFKFTNVAENKTSMVVTPPGSVELYHDNALRLATTTEGVNVTGNVTIPNDTGKFTVGVASDLQLYHNGNNFLDASDGNLYIRTTGGSSVNRNMYIRSNNNLYIQSNGSSAGIQLNSGGSTQIYHGGNGAKIIETSASGATVTGTLAATAVTGDGSGLTNLPSSGISTADSNVQVTYSITASGNNYRFTGPGNDAGDNNPDLYLVRGQRYRFTNNSGGSHPFQIRSAVGGSAYSTGVTNNGSASGNIDFNVQHDAPSRLYYQCTVHSAMVGNIYITGGGQWENTSVAASGTPEIYTDYNVGIGTDNPGEELHIHASGTSYIKFTDESSGVGGSDGVVFGLDHPHLYAWNYEAGDFVVATNATERLRIDSDGRLLLGTTTEGEATADNFTIADSGHCGITLRSGSDDVGTVFFSDGTSGTAEYEGYVQYDHDANFMKFATNHAERLRIDSIGRVNIGNSGTFTAAAVGRQIVEINGTSSALINLDVGGARKAYHFTDGTDVYSYNTAAGSYIFGTSDAEALRIDSSGRLLIAQTSSLLSYAGLQIAGDADTGAHICLSHKTATPVSGNNIGSVRFTNNAGGIGAIIGVEADGNWSGSSQPSRIILATTASGATSPTERIHIDSAGKIGINNSAPLYAMHFKNAMSSSPSFIHMEVTGTNAVGGGGGIAFDTSASSNASNNSLYLATIKGIRNSSDDGSNDLVFSTTKAGGTGDDGNTNTPKERLRIDSNGSIFTPYSTTAKVAINYSGSGTPSQNLYVQGDFYAREIYTQYKTRLTGSLIMDGDNDSQNTSLSGVKGIDIRMNGMYRRFSSQPAGDWTPNFQHNQSDIDSVTFTGDVFTATIIVKQRSAGSPNGVTVSGVQVDGTSTGVDLDWVGGSAPGASPGSGYDVWTFVVMKTSDTPTYHVLGKRETYS